MIGIHWIYTMLGSYPAPMALLRREDNACRLFGSYCKTFFHLKDTYPGINLFGNIVDDQLNWQQHITIVDTAMPLKLYILHWLGILGLLAKDLWTCPIYTSNLYCWNSGMPSWSDQHPWLSHNYINLRRFSRTYDGSS